jgi:uncharacterized protein YggU (UPF0235/DUF167 family)
MGQIMLQVVPGASARALEFIQTPSKPLENAPVLKVRLTERAEDGRANRALGKWLTELSGLPVQIVRGQRGRRKTAAFEGQSDAFLCALRQGLRREQE